MTTYLAQANTGSDALASTRSVTKPGTVTAGAVGVFWLVRWHESGSFPTVTPPSGAVLRGTITTASMETQCYLHRVSAETSYTYSWASGRWSALAALWFSGVDPAVDLATTSFQSATGSGTAISTLTVTAVADDALAWHVNTIATSGVTHNPPTGYTETADVSPWAAAYRISPGAGSQSASGATVSPTATWAAALVALPPAAAGGATGDATLASTAALSAAGLRATTGTAGLAGTGNLTGAGVRQTGGNAGLAVTADRAAAGTRGTFGTPALTVEATLAADGVVSTHATGDADLEALTTLTTSGQRAAATETALTAAAGLTASGIHGTLADAGLAATDTLTAQGTLDRTGPAALTATAALTASGTTLVSGIDDIDVTVGAPYSPWTASPPQASTWTARAPQAGSWKVGAPC